MNEKQQTTNKQQQQHAVTIEEEIAKMAQELNRGSAPQLPSISKLSGSPHKSINDRIGHIREEIAALDADLRLLQASMLEKIGVSDWNPKG